MQGVVFGLHDYVARPSPRGSLNLAGGSIGHFDNTIWYSATQYNGSFNKSGALF